jgi:hypothetical protein
MGTTARFRDRTVKALAPQISPPDPAEVRTVAYEQLFHLPLRGLSFYHLLYRRLGGYYRGKIAQYHRASITIQNFRYDQFPLVANG